MDSEETKGDPWLRCSPQIEGAKAFKALLAESWDVSLLHRMNRSKEKEKVTFAWVDRD